MATVTLLTPTVITREALRILENNLVFTKNVNRDYEDKFQKIGDTITIRKPNRFTIRTGATLSAQDVVEPSTTLKLDTQAGVDFTFDSLALTLTIEEFSDRYLKPAMATIANKIDADGCALYKQVWQAVGTVATPITSFATSAQLVGKQLDQAAVPDDGERALVLDPVAKWGLANGLTSLYNPQQQISSVFAKGAIGTIGGFMAAEDQNIVVHANGPRGGTPVLAAQPANGATSLSLSGWTASAANRVKKGDVFTLASIYMVNPQSRNSTGVLQQFVCTADTSSAADGTMTLVVSPGLYYTGPFQNINVQPTGNEALTFLGNASATYTANLAYHKDAFSLAVRPLIMPKGVDFSAQQSYKGISIRIVRAYSISDDTFPCRLDVLYGWKAIYPELACRLVA